MKEERMKEVFSDKAFVKELFSKETPEEVQAMLAEKGLDYSIEQIIQMQDLLVKKLQQAQAGKELGDDDLEDVAGGFLHPLLVVVFTDNDTRGRQ